jgi:hypothetical protein
MCSLIRPPGLLKIFGVKSNNLTYILNMDNSVESLAKLNKTVTPAKAGVQKSLKNLDSCFRRNDAERFLQEAPVVLRILHWG